MYSLFVIACLPKSERFPEAAAERLFGSGENHLHGRSRSLPPALGRTNTDRSGGNNWPHLSIEDAASPFVRVARSWVRESRSPSEISGGRCAQQKTPDLPGHG